MGNQEIEFCWDGGNLVGTDPVCERELTACWDDGDSRLETYHADCDATYTVCWDGDALVAQIPDDCCVCEDDECCDTITAVTLTVSVPGGCAAGINGVWALGPSVGGNPCIWNLDIPGFGAVSLSTGCNGGVADDSCSGFGCWDPTSGPCANGSCLIDGASFSWIITH